MTGLASGRVSHKAKPGPEYPHPPHGLERINVAFRGFLDEIPVENLPAAPLVVKPLRADLAFVVQPIRRHACQPADS